MLFLFVCILFSAACLIGSENPFRTLLHKKVISKVTDEEGAEKYTLTPSFFMYKEIYRLYTLDDHLCGKDPESIESTNGKTYVRIEDDDNLRGFYIDRMCFVGYELNRKDNIEKNSKN